MPDPLRLVLARAAAWALFVGAWLRLGQAGLGLLPLWAGGLLPLALWLALCAGCGRFVPAAHHRAVLAAATGLTALGLALGSAAGLLLAAAAWAVLAAAASQAVRRLRPPGRGASPLPAATLGVALAGLLSFGPGWLGVLLCGAGLGLLLPARWPADARTGPCRRGLFDALWPAAGGVAAGGVAAWGALPAARWTMLPMMAMLPLLGQWCSAAGVAPAPMLALHLAAMLAPAWLAHAARPAPGLYAPACALLLLAGAIAPWVWPGLSGLMLASLLHTGAWGTAWAADTAPRAAQPAGAAHALLPALLLLALGSALAWFGPPVLVLLHTLFALPAAWALRLWLRPPHPVGSG